MKSVMLISVFVASAVSITQFGIMLSFSAYQSDLATYWRIGDIEVKLIYTAMNWGVNLLCFFPGLIFDRWGTRVTALMGCFFTLLGVMLARMWSFLSVGFFFFGVGTAFINFTSVLSVLTAFPTRWAGLASAAVIAFNGFGSTFQVLIFNRYFSGAFGSFLNYIMVSSACCAVLPALVNWRQSAGDTLSVSDARLTPSSSSSVQLRRLSSGDCVSGSALCSQVGSTLSGPVGIQRLASSFISESDDPSVTISLSEALRTFSFVLLVAVYAIPIAFSSAMIGRFYYLGCVVGLSEDETSSLVAASGIASSLGRVILAMPSDFTTRLSPLLNKDLFFVVGIGSFTVGIGILRFSMIDHLRLGSSFVLFGYGGLLGLTPGKIRESFGSEFVGMFYGILYEIVAVFFTVWNYSAPSESKLASYEGWFSSAFVFALLCWLISLKLWLQGCFKKPDHDRSRSTNFIP